MTDKKENQPNTSKVVVSGNVKLKIVEDGRVLKVIESNNTATDNLFKGICLSLISSASTTLSLLVPHYIGVGDGEASSFPQESSKLIKELSVARGRLEGSYQYTKSSHWVSKFIGLITSISPIDVKEVGLFGDRVGDNLLARIQLEPAAQVKIDSKRSLLVEWTIQVENKSSGERVNE